MNTVEIGKVYKHYKGKLYKVHMVAKSAEDLSEFVVYECLYPNPEGQMWIRPLKMFTETIEIEGKAVPRFALHHQ